MLTFVGCSDCGGKCTAWMLVGHAIQSLFKSANIPPMLPSHSECLPWVKRRHKRTPATCPPYPRKRTSQRTAGMSALCQRRHYCSAANCSLLDHFVGAVRAEIDSQAQTWLAAQLGSRTELLPVACFEFFISELTSNAWPNPRT